MNTIIQTNQKTLMSHKYGKLTDDFRKERMQTTKVKMRLWFSSTS